MRKPLPHLEIALTVQAGRWPARTALTGLATDAVDAACTELGLRGEGESELSLVFTDDAAIRQLNARWRGKDRPTNVLSFPASSGWSGGPVPAMLGDIVLAHETIHREAELDDKPLDHHLTHLIVHGFLHLLGFDHESEPDAARMEDAERRILYRLAIPDPYGLTKHSD